MVKGSTNRPNNDDDDNDTLPAPSPNPAEKKRSKGGRMNEDHQELMDIEETEDATQDLRSKFDSMATETAAGPPRPSIVYDYAAEGKTPPTKLYSFQPDPVKEKATPYSASDVLPTAQSDTAEIHSMTLTGRAEINSKSKTQAGHPTTTQQWQDLFEKSFKGTGYTDRKMKLFALRLCKTPPAVFGELWANERLIGRDDTRAWKAAHTLLGALWHLKRKIQFAPSESFTHSPSRGTPGANRLNAPGASGVPTSASNSPRSSSSPPSHPLKPTPSTHVSKHGLFVSKKTPSVPTQLRLNELPRKYKTIMTARSSRLKYDGPAGDEEAVGIIQDMLQELKKIDPKLVLLPWNPQDQDNRPTTKFREISAKIRDVQVYG